MSRSEKNRPEQGRPEQDRPVMDGADDASNDEKLSGLIEQVDQDHGAEGAGAMADALRDRADETDTEITADEA